MPILEKFHERVRYLDCGVNEPITSTVSDVPVKVSESRQEDAKAMNRRLVFEQTKMILWCTYYAYMLYGYMDIWMHTTSLTTLRIYVILESVAVGLKFFKRQI